jgi:RND family efflux transporter MFP subunit
MKSLFWASLLAASAGIMAGCHGHETVETPGNVQTVQARVVESRQQQVPRTLQSTGTVHARETAIVSAQVLSRIEQVLVHEGDSVRAGQTLIVLDGAALESQLKQAEAGVTAAENGQISAQTSSALATSTLARYKQLESEKSVSPQEMDEISQRAAAAAASLNAARAQTDAARAQVNGARTTMGYTRLVAPFAGVVTARTADPGTMAAPGMPLLQVDQAGALELDATVDESAIATVYKGMKVSVSIDGEGATATSGRVAEIVPAADPSTHSFLVKIELPVSSQARAGMYGTAGFSNGVRNAILIPRSAVVTRGSLNCVYVLDSQGIAQLRTVTLGANQGGLVEVLSGISAGEKLIDAPADRDLAGKRVEGGTGVQP